MPIVFVSIPETDPEWATTAIAMEIITLNQCLPKIVADALSCDDPDGKLEPDDIGTRVVIRHPFDVSSGNIQFTIEANSYPSRLANLDERRSQIVNELKKIISPCFSFWVWVRLLPGSFEMVQPRDVE